MRFISFQLKRKILTKTKVFFVKNCTKINKRNFKIKGKLKTKELSTRNLVLRV